MARLAPPRPMLGAADHHHRHKISWDLKLKLKRNSLEVDSHFYSWEKSVADICCIKAKVIWAEQATFQSICWIRDLEFKSKFWRNPIWCYQHLSAHGRAGSWWTCARGKNPEKNTSATGGARLDSSTEIKITSNFLFTHRPAAFSQVAI